ncbi:hypothetical protein SAMN05444339_10686 [Loktanella atrilutea]|uniref:Uncharacterized protein n=1 Tax=Loktanella atrilutea TaxID=366533 RepID=A0A1M5BN66_LOKAT|nr:hypothetical protein [Loktanella atrilutea]SHF43825.1 hypothetical protein SAMN05444339_10686 [Loktanella atrilutea]
MARLILFFALLTGLALAAMAALAALRNLSDSEHAATPVTGLPGPVRMISFGFMILLLLGVSTGLVGAG